MAFGVSVAVFLIQKVPDGSKIGESSDSLAITIGTTGFWHTEIYRSKFFDEFVYGAVNF